MSALTPRIPNWLDRKLYPFDHHFIETPEGRIHYIDEGAGRPVVFVHGTPTWSFVYRHLITGLCDEFRCIAVDHLGFGLSDKPLSDKYHPADHARRLEQVLKQLDLGPCILVVHDFGGPIALDWATRYPQQIQGLVLLNTWMWTQADDPKVARLSRLVAGPLGRFLYRWLNFSPRVLLKMAFADKSKLTSSIHRHYLKPFSTRSERLGPWVLGCELASKWYDEIWERRESIAAVPTQLIWGLDDPIFQPGHLQRLESIFDNRQTLRLDGVGHFPQEEAPRHCIEAIRNLAAASFDPTGRTTLNS